MSYDISVPSVEKLIKELPEYKVTYDVKGCFHVSADTEPFLPVTTDANMRTVEAAQWKQIPLWNGTEEEAEKDVQARRVVSEGAFDEESYKYYIEEHRGLLWVDGFYETRTNSESGEIENYFICLPEKRIFSMGIVVAPRLGTKINEMINTFSVITTQANELLAELHDEIKRMPLIIPVNDQDEWLEARGKEQIQQFFKPFDGLLEAYKVARIPTHRTADADRPDAQDQVE